MSARDQASGQGRRGRSRGARLRAFVWWALTLLALGLAAAVVAAPLLGFHRYVITGGSMGDAVPRGSIAFDEVVPVSDLEVGDVITYTPPADSGVDNLVTHRIASIRSPEGTPVLRTKGDANETVDPWRFELGSADQARVAFVLPLAGYAIGSLGDPTIRMIAIGIPALLIAFGALRRLWRDSGEPAAETSTR